MRWAQSSTSQQKTSAALTWSPRKGDHDFHFVALSTHVRALLKMSDSVSSESLSLALVSLLLLSVFRSASPSSSCVLPLTLFAASQHAPHLDKNRIHAAHTTSAIIFKCTVAVALCRDERAIYSISCAVLACPRGSDQEVTMYYCCASGGACVQFLLGEHGPMRGVATNCYCWMSIVLSFSCSLPRNGNLLILSSRSMRFSGTLSSHVIYCTWARERSGTATSSCSLFPAET